MTTVADEQDDRIATRGSARMARIVGILRPTRRAEALAALVALVAIATLWQVPWAITVVAAAVIALGLWVVAVIEPSTYWLGAFVSARLVLVSGAVVAFLTRHDPVAGLCAVLVGVAVVVEAMFAVSIEWIASPPSANIPGVSSFSSLVGFSRVTHIALGASTVVAVASASFGIAWPAIAAGVLAIAFGGSLGFAVARANRRREKATQQALTALADLEPVFYLHWDAPAAGHYQVTMWMPYLKRLGMPFAVVVRTRNQMRALMPFVDVPLMLCTNVAQVDRSVVPSLRAVLFVNTALRNAHYLRFNGIRAIQLNHGDSDKPASATRQFRGYDRNLVAGQAAVDRFVHYGVHMPHKLLRIVGRPQVEAIRRPGARPEESRTVLYAPTWAGFFGDSNLSSLLAGEAIVRALIERGCTVIFRPHAFTDRNPALMSAADRVRALLAVDAERSGRAHLHGETAETTMSIYDCFNASDAMVADVSSIVSDYLYSEKPFAMVSVGMDRADFAAAYPVSRGAYVIDPAGPFDEAFDAMLGADPLRGTRQEARRYYLGDFPAEGYSDVFVTALREEIELGVAGID